MNIAGPTLVLGEFELSGVGKSVFRDCMYPRAQDPRKRTEILIDKRLLDAYEKHNPKMKNGRYSGEGLSNTVNKALAAWMEAYGML